MTARRGHPRFYELIDEICTLHARKNSDYARDDDPLSNFRQAEALGIPAWKGVLVRMSDKWSRIQELTRGKAPQNESLRDSLVDLAVYALIDIVLLEELPAPRASYDDHQANAQPRTCAECGTEFHRTRTEIGDPPQCFNCLHRRPAATC